MRSLGLRAALAARGCLYISYLHKRQEGGLDTLHDGVLASSEAPMTSLYRVCYSGCLQGVAKSGQVLFNSIEAALVPTLIALKWRALL